MEHADWLMAGYSAAEARFLMLTAMTNHQFTSPAWGEEQVRRLLAELAEIDATAAQILAPVRGPSRDASSQPSGIYGLNRRRPQRPDWDEQEAS